MVGIAIILKIVIVTFLVRWTRDIVRQEAVPTSEILVVFDLVADWRRQPAGGARAARWQVIAAPASR
ncbi:MAG TPA: hypothetical protein QF469_19915, partial [Sphingomonas sanguinis]|uniref:hypothetical protein n=1 Tax=Sphingomonas sanguinis TaxID=33051 RepID=UPI002AC13321|nr:hypothetical protein [Sphingomonas sanguinis]